MQAAASQTTPPSCKIAALIPAYREAAAIADVVQALSLFAARDLGRRLPGFSASSAPYIAVNLLVGPGSFRFEPATSRASLPDVPLRVALQMAGWEDRIVTAPWLPGGTLRFCRSDP